MANLDLFDAATPEPEPEAAKAERGEPEPRGAQPGVEEREFDAGIPDPVPEKESFAVSEPKTWTVSEVNEAVRSLLEASLPPLWVTGEVANWTRARSGHCYFTLKDESAQLRCVMWRTEAAQLPADPDQGMQLRAFGRPTLYPARGEFQLVVQLLEAEGGEGLWRLAFERLKKRLDKEGLTALERKRPLPRFPQTVGVVTSLTGAALHDILTVLGRRAPWLRVLVRGTRVQGEGAASEIAEAIGILGGSGAVDVLIVGRGGGSIEDLWAFNEEVVARAVADAPVPVISAVGHEVDVTISDLVADLRAATPSAAAEAVAPDKEEILRVLASMRVRLARGLRQGVDRRKLLVREGRRALARLGPGLPEARRARTVAAMESMGRSLREGVARKRAQLAAVSGRIDALSPLSVLQRGFAVPQGPDGRVLRGVADFPVGEEFRLRVADGRVICETTETHPGRDRGVQGES